MIGEGNGNPLQYSRLENPMDGGAWWAAFYGVAQSGTRLKWLSSSSSSSSNFFDWISNRSFTINRTQTHILGREVSLHSCSSKAQPLLLTLDEGYLLTAALPDLQRGIAPLGPPAPAQPGLLDVGLVLPAATPGLGHGGVGPWSSSSRLLPLASGLGTWSISSRRRP